jgi:hypothetical protein
VKVYCGGMIKCNIILTTISVLNLMMDIEFISQGFNSKIAQQDTVLRAAPGGGGGFLRPNRFELIPVSSLVFFANVDLKTRKITSGRSVCGSMLLLWPHYTFFHFTSRALSAL